MYPGCIAYKHIVRSSIGAIIISRLCLGSAFVYLFVYTYEHMYFAYDIVEYVCGWRVLDMCVTYAHTYL